MITTFPAFMAWRNLQRLSRTPALPFRAARLSTQRNFHVRPTSPALRKLAPPSIVNRVQLRRGSDHVPPNPLTNRDEEVKDKSAEEIAARKAQEPAYEMTFTCRKCITRSSHRVTKQAYHFGTTLITCPGCKNRHLISDHLKIFSDKGITIEDILNEKGQYLKKGRLGEDGDIEFYEDKHRPPA